MTDINSNAKLEALETQVSQLKESLAREKLISSIKNSHNPSLVVDLGIRDGLCSYDSDRAEYTFTPAEQQIILQGHPYLVKKEPLSSEQQGKAASAELLEKMRKQDPRLARILDDSK
jgi:hypothetical protein